ncbi:MAG TPA: hypothetical protein VFB58_04555 [Chloroflexota bacterium]|nr:hypothetical protein [Chloroflexota bacterium]
MPQLSALTKRRYDTAYIVLTHQLGAALRTFDGPLAGNAGGLGFSIHVIEQEVRR